MVARSSVPAPVFFHVAVGAATGGAGAFALAWLFQFGYSTEGSISSIDWVVFAALASWCGVGSGLTGFILTKVEGSL